MTKIKEHFIQEIIWVAVIVLTFINAPTVQASHQVGEAFTDPSSRQTMPAEWHKKPIAYESWARGADLSISLDQHLYPALLPLIKEYGQKKKINIRVHEGTCGTSSGLLNRKNIDIGGFCCPPSNEDRLPGLQFHTLGIGALAILINSANPLDNVSLAEARNIFKGKFFRWDQLSQKATKNPMNRTIRVIGRLHCKQRPGHWRLILDNEDLFSPRMKEVATIKDMMFTVATIKEAIGYEVLWNIDLFKVQEKVKALKINNISPWQEEALISGKYPFYRTFNITTWKEQSLVNPHAQELLTYLMEQIKNIDKSFGIISAHRVRQQGWQFQGNELIGELADVTP